MTSYKLLGPSVICRQHKDGALPCFTHVDISAIYFYNHVFCCESNAGYHKLGAAFYIPSEVCGHSPGPFKKLPRLWEHPEMSHIDTFALLNSFGGGGIWFYGSSQWNMSEKYTTRWHFLQVMFITLKMESCVNLGHWIYQQYLTICTDNVNNEGNRRKSTLSKSCSPSHEEQIGPGPEDSNLGPEVPYAPLGCNFPESTMKATTCINFLGRIALWK
jgi:hypothetical protein